MAQGSQAYLSQCPFELKTVLLKEVYLRSDHKKSRERGWRWKQGCSYLSRSWAWTSHVPFLGSCFLICNWHLWTNWGLRTHPVPTPVDLWMITLRALGGFRTEGTQGDRTVFLQVPPDAETLWDPSRHSSMWLHPMWQHCWLSGKRYHHPSHRVPSGSGVCLVCKF